MASKQLGKLRQWAGEVISSKDKTTVSEEFQDLEKDIELRREGATRLLAASEGYQHALSKKKKNEAVEDADKLLPIDTLGIAMVVHGEDFGGESAFGTSLVRLGRAHCKIASLQEAYALTLNDTFMASLQQFTEDIREYDAQRKKLDSRRLTYDAAIAKFEKLKNSKKEKERRDAEDEMDKARQRYDEMSEDVQGHMHAIQEKEIDQLRDLTAFLDLEIGFVEQYLSVLKEVKEGWYEESSIVQIPPRRASGTLHVFARPNSVQSRASNRSHTRDPSDSDGESVSQSPKKSSRRSMSISSKPPSRPASRASRKRSDSAATVGGEKEDKKRINVAGWASSAVGSVTGRKKKDKFATLNDAEDDQAFERDADEAGVRTSPKKPSSFHSLSRKLSMGDKSKGDGSPKLGGAKILKPPSLQGRKTVRAVHSFSGGADELTFSAGDEIVVVNEVLEDWWMGELNGKKGLFPTTYVETTSPKPPLPKRYGATPHRTLLDNDSDSYLSTDADDDQDFHKQPLSAQYSSPFFNGPPDVASSTSSLAETFDDKLQVPFLRNSHFDTGFDDDGDDVYFRSVPVSRASPVPPERKVLQSLNSLPQPPQIARRTNTEPIPMPAAASVKKAPPPPPPRRPTLVGSGPTPPIPERISKSNSLGQLKVPTPASSISSHDRSPFDSTTDLLAPGAVQGCDDFRQNPFQAAGMCSNCFQHHG